MNQKFALIFCCFFALFSCKNTDKSTELLNQAIDVYYFSALEEKTKIDSALRLTNKALELDNENTKALNHKSILLFRKRDLDGLLKVTDQLIELNPAKPYFICQKAIYLNLKGDKKLADKLFDDAFRMYNAYFPKTA